MSHIVAQADVWLYFDEHVHCGLFLTQSHMHTVAENTHWRTKFVAENSPKTTLFIPVWVNKETVVYIHDPITNGLGAESHRQELEVRKYWEMNNRGVVFGNVMGFIDNNQNMLYYQPYPL